MTKLDKSKNTWGKRLASGSLAATIMLSAMMPTNVLASTKREELQEVFNELANSQKESLYSNQLQLELERNPIREGVDITSLENQSIIVQFKSLPLAEVKALNNGVKAYSLKSDVKDEHNKFNQFLASMSKEREKSYSIKHSYYNTFNGVALDIKGTDIEKLLESGVVKAIWKDEVARTEPEGFNPKSEENSKANNNSKMVSSTPLIEVDKLRAEGITGEGIKVGVIDTGIDYNHPDLKENYKGGYDFVDNDNDPMETTREDWQKSGEPEQVGESSYYTSHGTHVAGTIGATGSNTESEFAVTGIAPNVDLYGYRVLGPYGVGATADILAGIEKAVEDGMDVINLSLGIGVTDPLYPVSVACNNAALVGTIPVVANGNSGPEFSTLGSPGTSPLSISVGASSTYINVETFNIELSKVNLENGEDENSTKIINFNGRLIGKNYDGLSSFTNKELEIVYGGLGYEYELNDLDVKGKILLIDRGEITFAEKLTNAQKAGAAALIIANNVPDSELNIFLGEDVRGVNAIGISMEYGQTIKDVIAASEDKFTANIEVNGKATTDGDLLVDFSSRGPASDETIKPDVVAPGVSIFSTYPEFINSPEEGIDYSTAYSRISGTSMASPHVAGVVALMLQNNPDLSASDVKVALMNTCDDLQIDYAINAMGAGRVNAYKAVHADVAVSVLDKAYSMDENNEKIEIDYITGSLSYDRIRKGSSDANKSLPIRVDNNGDENKTFNVSVRYLGNDQLAQNAEENGVTVKVPENVTVKAGKSSNFDAEIAIPKTAEVGRYEGYIILTNTADESEEYTIPFSATYVIPGIKSVELSRPAVSTDLEMMHFAKIAGATVTVEVSSPLKYVEMYVKDFDTKEVIGFLGIADFSNIPGGGKDSFYAIDDRGSYFPMKNGEVVESVKSSLKDGKYIIEFVGKDLETDDEYVVERNVLIDNEDAKMTFDKEAGVYEISDDMLTTEEYYGEDFEAFWVHGNVTDNSTSILQEMGYNVTSSNIVISGFVNGMPYFSLDVDENGDFKFGIEKQDLETGNVYEFSPMPIDVATSQNLFKQPRYFFVKKGTPYTSVTLNKDKMNLNDVITSTITTNNLEAGSKFNFTLGYAGAFEVMDIRVNDELQKVLDDNNYNANIEKSISGDRSRELALTLDITDKDGNAVEVSGTNKMIDVDLKLTYDSESEFYREYIQCNSVDVLDKEGNYANMSFSSTYEGVDIVPSTSTLFVSQLAQGFTEAMENGNYTKDLDKYIWVVDDNGNKYNLEYDKNMNIYMVTNLPVSDKEYTVYTALPGHFNKKAKFVPSREVDGKVVSKVYYLLGSEFYRYIAAGDVNNDGWVDILDALEVEKFYGKKVDYNENPVDFNFDGVVNEYDMDYIVQNFGQYNEQIAEGKPVLEYNGKTLNDILNDTGYNTVSKLDSIVIEESEINLEVNESQKLNLTIAPSDYQAEVKWTSFCEDIAVVDENGVVTGVNTGTTYIKASVDNGKLSAYCFVTVTKDGVITQIESVTPNKTSYELKVGDVQELDFTVNPEDVVIKSIEYVSAANSIAEVVDGKVVAKSLGKTIITANINSGAAKVTWEIVVSDNDKNNGDNVEGGDNEGNTKPGTPSEPQDPTNPQNPTTPSEPVKPNESGSKEEDKSNTQMPVTGGRATLPLVTAAIGMIYTGVKMRKRK